MHIVLFCLTSNEKVKRLKSDAETVLDSCVFDVAHYSCTSSFSPGAVWLMGDDHNAIICHIISAGSLFVPFLSFLFYINNLEIKHNVKHANPAPCLSSVLQTVFNARTLSWWIV